jgi:molybdate transport system substrate-binding protein
MSSSHSRFMPGLLSFLVGGAVSLAAQAEQATVAVAANFLVASQALELEFEAATGHQLVFTSGSTGQLYAQVVNGAPFDVLLAADQERPRLLAERDLGDPASVFTYAIGQLVLWSSDADRIAQGALADNFVSDFRFLAVSEPGVAPYGSAARQTLENLGLWSGLQQRIVRGQNVAQTFQMVATGNAQLGLVALSQALTYPGQASYQVIPSGLHDPLRQDAILLRHGAGNAAAVAFLEFLKQPAAAAILHRFGYLPAEPQSPTPE